MTRAIQRDYFHVLHLSIAKAIPNGAKSCCGHISRIHSVARSATVFHLTMQMHLDTNPTLLAVAELEMNRRGGIFSVRRDVIAELEMKQLKLSFSALAGT